MKELATQAFKIVSFKSALIDIFGLEKAKEIYNNSFSEILTETLGRPTLDIILFDMEINTPENMTWKEHLTNLAGDKTKALEFIINYFEKEEYVA